MEIFETRRADLEDIKRSASVKARLLVRRVKNGGLRAFLWGERRGEIKFKAFGKEVVKLDLVAEDVGRCPGLG